MVRFGKNPLVARARQTPVILVNMWRFLRHVPTFLRWALLRFLSRWFACREKVLLLRLIWTHNCARNDSKTVCIRCHLLVFWLATFYERWDWNVTLIRCTCKYKPHYSCCLSSSVFKLICGNILISAIMFIVLSLWTFDIQVVSKHVQECTFAVCMHFQCGFSHWKCIRYITEDRTLKIRAHVWTHF